MQTIDVSAADRTLFHLAARFYGDATLWLLIAEANCIGDPMILGIIRGLKIPDADPIRTGGLPQQ